MALWLETRGLMLAQSGSPMPSQREDILRGLAKVKLWRLQRIFIKQATIASQIVHVFRACCLLLCYY